MTHSSYNYKCICLVPFGISHQKMYNGVDVMALSFEMEITKGHRCGDLFSFIRPANILKSFPGTDV